MTSEEQVREPGTLNVHGETISIQGIRIAMQVAGKTVLTTAALVDLEEVPVYAVTHQEVFVEEDALTPATLQELPTKAVQQLRHGLLDDGLILTNPVEVILGDELD